MSHPQQPDSRAPARPAAAKRHQWPWITLAVVVLAIVVITVASGTGTGGGSTSTRTSLTPGDPASPSAVTTTAPSALRLTVPGTETTP